MNEAQMYAKLRANIKGHWQRVENGLGEGTPDVSFCVAATKREGWIELKSEGTQNVHGIWFGPKFRPAQLPWLLQREAAGGNAWVLTLVDDVALLLMRPSTAYALVSQKGVGIEIPALARIGQLRQIQIGSLSDTLCFASPYCKGVWNEIGAML